MRVLVTGATGFLGSWIVRELARAGHSPRALVRRRAAIPEPDIECVPGDVLDRASIERAMEGVDAVIHAAGKVGVSESGSFAVNVDGTRNVLEAARARGVRAVHTSSIGAIGVTSMPVVLDERSRFTALGRGFAYVESKCQAEDIARSLATSGLDVVILNPGIALGPGDVYFTSTQLVLSYLRGLVLFYPRGGTSFCDVRDVAAAHVAALTRGRRGERYIVGGENLPYGALFDRLWMLSGLHRPWPLAGPVADTMALFSEAAGLFGLNPFPDVAAGLRFSQFFNYGNSSMAASELGYRARDLTSTLRDTITDHLVRGVAQAITPELRALRDAIPDLSCAGGDT